MTIGPVKLGVRRSNNVLVDGREAPQGGRSERLFRPKSAINAAVFDAVMVGCARSFDPSSEPAPERVAAGYEGLLADKEFQDAYRKATADDENVKTRLSKATEIFAKS